MARKYNGILSFTYDIGGGAVEVTKMATAPNNSGVTFPEKVAPEDTYGNRYAGLQYAEVTLNFLDLTAGAAIEGEWQTDDTITFVLTLDNSQTMTCTAIRLREARPWDIDGKAEGRADGYTVVFRCPSTKYTLS